jgi:dCTP deaminase
VILPGQMIRLRGIFTPFSERGVYHGLSYGLSCAGYDVRLRDDVTLVQGYTIVTPTLEHMAFPPDLIGMVADKSTWARLGVAVQNTICEPGWSGVLAIELTYQPVLTPEQSRTIREQPQRSPPATLALSAGTPIAQILVSELKALAERPYGDGKYQNQSADDCQAKLEGQARGPSQRGERSGEVSERG